MFYWYTLYTKPNSEHCVEAVLRRRGLTTYLPKIAGPTKRDHKRMNPFFPCYMFARIDFDCVGISCVRWTPGLRRVVAVADKPVPLGDEVINEIRNRLERLNASDCQKQASFQAGQVVRITEGPLEGMLAIFEGPSEPSERVRVLLEFLGRISRVKVQVDSLETVHSRVYLPATMRPRRTRGKGRRIYRRTNSPSTTDSSLL
jgi:transcriptional antiterminator RfaH